MTTKGIEKIHAYPSTLYLDMGDLCRARGRDEDYVRKTLLVDQRSVLPPWEDPVTLAVNAADPMLSAEDRDRIGLLIVGTETGVDHEKPISTWVHRFLGLGSRCRTFDVKHACYGATAGLRMALNWLASGEAKDRTALVISADHSLMGIGENKEPVLGAGAVALLVSGRPEVFVVDGEHTGIYAEEGGDVIRPTLQVETGNGSASLICYLDALEGAWADYLDQACPVDIEADFAANVYHAPFPGMTQRAHRALLQRSGLRTTAELAASFERQVAPSLCHVRRMNGSYGASTFIALLSLAEKLDPDARVSIFAYGAGSCSEFYAGRMGSKAKEIAKAAALGRLLDERRALPVDVYEAIERARDAAWGVANYKPARDLCPGHFDAAYAGRGRLILSEVRSYVRCYERS